jgi:hypothetical protein
MLVGNITAFIFYARIASPKPSTLQVAQNYLGRMLIGTFLLGLVGLESRIATHRIPLNV